MKREENALPPPSGYLESDPPANQTGAAEPVLLVSGEQAG